MRPRVTLFVHFDYGPVASFYCLITRFFLDTEIHKIFPKQLRSPTVAVHMLCIGKLSTNICFSCELIMHVHSPLPNSYFINLTADVSVSNHLVILDQRFFYLSIQGWLHYSNASVEGVRLAVFTVCLLLYPPGNKKHTSLVYWLKRARTKIIGYIIIRILIKVQKFSLAASVNCHFPPKPLPIQVNNQLLNYFLTKLHNNGV